MCVCVCVTPPPIPACPQSVTAATLREDKEVRQFFSSLVESHLDRDSPLARVDLLQSSLLHGSEGADTLQELRALLKVGGGRAGQWGNPYHYLISIATDGIIVVGTSKSDELQ